MTNETKEIKYTDLFGGVGGFRLGIQRAWSSLQQSRRSRKDILQRRYSPPSKIKCTFYCDNDKYAVQTYNKNFKENWKATDIRTIKAGDIPDFDMLCGGFPCQAFSIAGKRRGFQDTRGTLFFEITRIIKAKRPKIIFLENVKGLLNHEKGKTFKIILQTLSELGYDIQWMVLNSKFFGVPQNRERVFIIGNIRGTSRPEILPFRENNKINNQSNGKRNEVTYCLQPSDKHRGSYAIHNVYGGFNEGIRESNIFPTLRTPKGGGHLPMVSQALQTDGQLRQGSSWGTDKSQSSRNIRRLTPTESERLQGFPNNWTEGVSDTQRYKQMGNAVTVNVVQAIAEKLLK